MNFFNAIALVVFSTLLYPNILHAQIEYSALANHAPQNLETKALVILFTSDISDRKVMPESENSEDISSNSLTTAELYDKSAVQEFGSFVNPYTNQLRIVPNDDVLYTKIQITNKSTGKTIIKKDLSNGNNLVDLTLMTPGKYILIMTDSGKNIFSEEVTII